jgi:hypothetical protein
MKETKLVRFPNESEPQKVELDMKQFLFSREFEGEIWGIYNNTYIAIKKEEKNEPIEEY